MAPVDFSMLTAALPVGVIATAILDLWALFLNRVLRLPVTDWAVVGRWLAGIPAGNWRYRAADPAPDVGYDRLLGWSFHYLVGIAYAAAWLAVLALLSAPPSVAAGLLFGVATVLAPWLLLQPALGLGLAASRSPKPTLTRSLNLIAHSVFGIGLYAGWRLAGMFA